MKDSTVSTSFSKMTKEGASQEEKRARFSLVIEGVASEVD
jgi:hypothetical protein